MGVDRSVPENPPERNIQLRIPEVISELLRVRGEHALAGDDVVGELAERERSAKAGAGSSAGRFSERPSARANSRLVTGCGAVTLNGPDASGVCTIHRTISIQSRR